VAFGLGLGLVSAMFLLQGIQKLLFKVTLADPLVLSLVVTVFVISACAACLAPALRALADDPATTLRHQ
jgi:ABC-type antimicrobial peptide transport system permease subunit